MERLTEILNNAGLGDPWAGYGARVGLLLALILLVVILDLVTQKVVLRVMTRVILTNKYTWDDKLLERKVFRRLSHILPALVVYGAAPLFPTLEGWISKGAIVYLLVAMTASLSAFFNALDDIYREYEISRERPIKGYLQVLKVIVFVVAGTLIIANLIGQSPLIILSGFGALAAALIFVFRDSLLGLVAGIQLAANDMVRLGDWIEMPKYGADGDVVDISLNTVKVENFDRTITTIPTYALVSDSFKNWRGIQAAGGRRIMRSVHLDLSSVGFCTEEQLAELKKIRILREYIETKQEEIRVSNEEKGLVPGDPPVNGRRLTNIGVFRVYLGLYLDHHPGIHQCMIKLVRQMEPDQTGVALQIYGFTNQIDWISFETIQADIFDHVLAVVPYFGLRLYQQPSGADLQHLQRLQSSPSEGASDS